MRAHSSLEHGFTLVELLVALFIFAMLAAAGVALFGYAVRSQEGVATRLAATGDEGRLVALLSADLGQAVPRIRRDEAGGSVAAFTGTNGVGRAAILSFVRGGRSDPGGEGRSGLQRVEWRVADGRFERVGFDHVDGGTSATTQTLARDVTRIAARYRGGAAWSDRWQPSPGPALLPRAVELTIERRRRPPLTMAFLVGVDGA